MVHIAGVTFEHSLKSGESVYIRILICDIIPHNYNTVIHDTGLSYSLQS